MLSIIICSAAFCLPPVEQRKLKVAAVSCVIEGGSPAKNLEQIAKWSKLAAEKGADLVLFNETSATGYWQSLKLRKLAEPLDGPTVKQLIKIANENNIVICAGMIEKAGDKAHNTQVIVGPKGLIGYHRKSRLPGGEEQWFDIGSDQNVFEVKGIKIGVAICFESIQPDTCRTLTAKGSQVILAPYCNGVSAADIHNGKRPYLSNRAKENHVWYIACDQFGLDNSKPDKPVSSGAVCFVNPKGEIVATTALEEKKEHLIVYDLNLSLPDTK